MSAVQGSASNQARPIDRFGIGLAALGRPAYINIGRADVLPERRTAQAMQQQANAVLDAAHAEGIRWVDAARSYGSAERFLADWLTDRAHDDVTVSSKWGYVYVAEWRIETEVHEVKEHSLEQFRSQWAETSQLLGDRVRLYQVHSLTADSELFSDAELQGALARLRDSGVRVGFSTSGASQADIVERAASLEVGGQRLFSAVQVTWNSMEPSVERAAAHAHADGLQVLVKEPLANGRLAVAPPPQLQRVADEHGVGADAIALAHVLSRPWADVVLLGPAGVDQLRSNLRARTVRLTQEQLGELATVATDAATYWGQRADLPWH